MPKTTKKQPTQPIGKAIMVVMMEVDPEHEAEFNRWYDEEHLPERLEIPGYVSARRFKLVEAVNPRVEAVNPREEGDGVLKYLCIWELEEDGSPMKSAEYRAQQLRESELRDRVHGYIKRRARGLYRQIYPATGAFVDHAGFHPEGVTAKGSTL